MDKPGTSQTTTEGAIILRKPEEVAPTPGDVITDRLAAGGLVGLALACVVGIVATAVMGKEVPQSLPMLATTAIGILGGFLSRVMKQA